MNADTHVRHDDTISGYFTAFCLQDPPSFDHHGFRWHESMRPGVWHVRTSKAAVDDGKPARLVRSFNAVVDDFGTLVEVEA